MNCCNYFKQAVGAGYDYPAYVSMLLWPIPTFYIQLYKKLLCVALGLLHLAECRLDVAHGLVDECLGDG